MESWKLVAIEKTFVFEKSIGVFETGRCLISANGGLS